MDQTADRQQSRIVRVHGAEGVMPLPLWLVSFLIVGVILIFMLLLADRGERATTQALLMGSVTAVITTLMLLLVFFDHPHSRTVVAPLPTSSEAFSVDICPAATEIEATATMIGGPVEVKSAAPRLSRELSWPPADR